MRGDRITPQRLLEGSNRRQVPQGIGYVDHESDTKDDWRFVTTFKWDSKVLVQGELLFDSHMVTLAVRGRPLGTILLVSL